MPCACTSRSSRCSSSPWGSASFSTSLAGSSDNDPLTHLTKPGFSMRHILTAVMLSLLTEPLLAQGAPPQVAADQPYTMEYYYKAHWGHQQEFLQLFLKNHYPLLKKEVESGRVVSIKIETPANHMTEDARWDYRVTLKFKNSTVATTANPQEEGWV